MRSRSWLILLVAAMLFSACLSAPELAPPEFPDQPGEDPTPSAEPTTSGPSISGIVLGEEGPIAGAVVRVQATNNFTKSDAQGHFTLPLESDSVSSVRLTGWALGYFCSGPFTASPVEQDITIQLIPHADDDNSEYRWLPSRLYPGQGENQGCAECHSREGTAMSFSLPVDEWLLDAHSQSAMNPRFLTMYNGTDLEGHQSPLTRMGYSRDYGTFPLPPDPSQPYFGPGYKLDFPDSAGNCAACHTPAAAIDSPYNTDPNAVAGVEAEGLPCDFCHKIWDVKLDPSTGMPYANTPGVLSYEFRRPYEGHQFFSGPFDDVAPGEDTYSELQTQSAFCAPCHFGVFWDTTIYNSYGEWLSSSYSDPDIGMTCQDCHMPPLGATQFATDEAGGLTRDPSMIFSHRMPGAQDEVLLQDALDLQVHTTFVGDSLEVLVSLHNDNTGHNIPTDSPLRHMLLIIEAVDQGGTPLTLIDGPVLPDWTGIGDPESGYYADQPGKAYALILQELWTEITPTGAYWNPTRIVEDTRLEPFEEDFSRYIFEMKDVKEIKLQVRVILRRAFIDLMDQKGWIDPDMLIAEEFFTLLPE